MPRKHDKRIFCAARRVGKGGPLASMTLRRTSRLCPRCTTFEAWYSLGKGGIGAEPNFNPPAAFAHPTGSADEPLSPPGNMRESGKSKDRSCLPGALSGQAGAFQGSF
jgi:hypothetical protein